MERQAQRRNDRVRAGIREVIIMVRPIKSSSVDMLREEMLNYGPFKNDYSERIANGSLKDLLYIVRKEMRMRSSDEMKAAGAMYTKNKLGRDFYKDQILIDGINTYALTLAQRAGMIVDFSAAHSEDRTGYATKKSANAA